MADLVVKLSAIVVALLAANFFLLRPDVRTHAVLTERRVDRVELRKLYREAGKPMPQLVARTLETYEQTQQTYQDNLELPPYREPELAQGVCRYAPNSVPKAFFFEQHPCKEQGAWLASAAEEHELMLIEENAHALNGEFPPGVRPTPPLSASELTNALRLARDAQYFSQVYEIKNTGRAAADPVRVVPPGGFTQTSKEPLIAPLSPGNRRVFEFRTDRAPRSQIEVSWDARPSDPATTAVKVLLGVFLVIVLAVVANDIYRTAKDPPPEPEAPS
jgi:hypothetical protein